MSSYQTDAVSSYRDLARSITEHLNQPVDLVDTLSFLQGLRDTCLDHHVEYDKGLCGADDDEHVELLYDNDILKLHEWSVRATDELYWVRQQLERDLPESPALHAALLDNTRTTNPTIDAPDHYTHVTNRVRTLLCELDVRIQYNGVSLTPVFHVANPEDDPDVYVDTVETPEDGPSVQLAFDNQSPVRYAFYL